MYNRKESRRNRAKVRDELRATLSYQQRLDRLNDLFGAEDGAKKERARLKALISEASKEKTPKEAEDKKKAPENKAS